MTVQFLRYEYTLRRYIRVELLLYSVGNMEFYCRYLGTVEYGRAASLLLSAVRAG